MTVTTVGLSSVTADQPLWKNLMRRQGLRPIGSCEVLKSKCESVSCSVCLTLATPWTVAHQAPLSVEFSRQEYWSGLPCPSPGDLPGPGVEPGSPALQADPLPSKPPGKPRKGLDVVFVWVPGSYRGERCQVWERGGISNPHLCGHQET